MELLSNFVSFILHIDVHLFELANQYGLWLYAILFVIVFCETGLVVTPFLPGDSLLFASGVVAGAGHLGYGEVMGVLLAAGILGDAVNYFIGRHAFPGFKIGLILLVAFFLRKGFPRLSAVVKAPVADKMHAPKQVIKVKGGAGGVGVVLLPFKPVHFHVATHR